MTLKQSPETFVIVPSLPACKQQEAGERLPVGVTAYVQPHSPGLAVQCQTEAAALVCSRMLSEGGKIHLQSVLVLCFCCACFLCHPCIPAALSPQAHSSQVGCPYGGDTVTAARTVCSLAWRAPRAPNSPRQDQLTPSHLPPWGLWNGPRTRGLLDVG